MHYLTRRMKIFPARAGEYFICNAITGEIMMLSEAGLHALEVLRRGTAAAQYQQLANILAEKSFLFDSQEEEERVFRSVCQNSFKEFQDHSPFSYTFIVNTQCNFNCFYCFEPEASRKKALTLRPDQIDSAFSIIDEQAASHPDQETPSVEIFGGEPLLPHSKPTVAYLLKKIAEHHLTASIQTNGYFLSEYMDLVSEHRNHIGLIQITLDGPPDIHNQRRIPGSGEPTFERIVTGIDEFLQRDLPIQLNLRTNVDRENVNYLETLAGLYEIKGWRHNPKVSFVAAPVDNRCGNLQSTSQLISWLALFERVFPISSDTGGPFDLSVFKAISYFRNYFSALVHNSLNPQFFVPKIVYCEAAALKLFVFHPDGRIYPCPEAVGRQELSVGTFSPSFCLEPEQTLPWKNRTILKREKCSSCEISTFCGGGCILTALLQNGSACYPVCEDAPEIIASYFNKIVSTV